MKTVDLKPHWDETTVLRNPHKGWYHHYFDNGIRNYLPQNDAELEAVPGSITFTCAWPGVFSNRNRASSTGN
jgi:hypothetical protein